MTKLLAKGLLLLILAIVLTCQSSMADDMPAPIQVIGNHAGVSARDVEIRDDELMEYICEQIQKDEGKVKDVKLMVNSAYGGGLLDDMEKVFGPDGACENIPWVAGSASDLEQTSRGAADVTVDENPGDELGSSWTDALAGVSRGNVNDRMGVIRNGSTTNNVMQDLLAAGENDHAGPGGVNLETPLVASGNGGDQIQWHVEGEKHEAILFGGKANRERHLNNISNMSTSLKNTWPDGSYTIQQFAGGTRQELYDAIEAAASRLDENTQLVLYFDDHGSAAFDFDEGIGDIADVPIEEYQSWVFEFPEGWYEGMWGSRFNDPYELPDPALQLWITLCEGCSDWSFYFNGQELAFEGEDRTGFVRLPIPWWSIWPGANLLEIEPGTPAALQSGNGKPQDDDGVMTVSRMEVSTGPVNEQEHSLLKPGQSAAFYDPLRSGEGIFVELFTREQALVYMFTYDTTGQHQAWMLGMGYQTGNGIVVDELLMPFGARFGPGFDPDDVILTDFGDLVFNFPTCGSSEVTGSLFIHPKGDTGYHLFGNNNYVQLTSILSCETDKGNTKSKFSGSWYDPAHEGEGIILEVLLDGTAVVQWFTYDDKGNQMWIQGAGTFDGSTLTAENLYTTSGASWGVNFDPDDVNLVPWGSLSIEFTSCNTADLAYQSTAGFGESTLKLERVTRLLGTSCFF